MIWRYPDSRNPQINPNNHISHTMGVVYTGISVHLDIEDFSFMGTSPSDLRVNDATHFPGHCFSSNCNPERSKQLPNCHCNCAVSVKWQQKGGQHGNLVSKRCIPEQIWTNGGNMWQQIWKRQDHVWLTWGDKVWRYIPSALCIDSSYNFDMDTPQVYNHWHRNT